MPTISFTENLQRHIDLPTVSVPGESVAAALEHVFQKKPAARSYLLDDDGQLRKHMLIFVDNVPIRDRQGLSDPVTEQSEIHVFQALSGG